jgi:Fic family protein
LNWGLAAKEHREPKGKSLQKSFFKNSVILSLQKDTRTRNVHASTAIEGNPLTLEQVRALEEGREPTASGERARREVVNYFAGLRFVEKYANKSKIGHEDVLRLHRILAGNVMDQGEAGRYRSIQVRVGVGRYNSNQGVDRQCITKCGRPV